VKQISTAEEGFRMLGCWIKTTSTGVEVSPTKENLSAFDCHFQHSLTSLENLLTYSATVKSPASRLEGVQAYLRLRNHVKSWVAAYPFFEDIAFY
jgi:hypothetical protein